LIPATVNFSVGGALIANNWVLIDGRCIYQYEREQKHFSQKLLMCAEVAFDQCNNKYGVPFEKN
jgi:hypothetical protein